MFIFFEIKFRFPVYQSQQLIYHKYLIDQLLFKKETKEDHYYITAKE
jgi:hypothetical protein